MDKMLCLKAVQWRIFLSYPYKHEPMYPNSFHFWGKHKLGSFYPKIMTQYKGLDACGILQSDIILHLRVTH